MPSAHAKLSPSSSERWISCPASIRLAETVQRDGDGDNIYAREGTIAHALGELEAGLAFGLITKEQYLTGLHAWHQEFDAQGYDPGTLKEMQDHIQDYVAFIAERVGRYPLSRVLLEQRLDTGVPKCWGTSDVVIVSPDHVEIIDLKYGTGVPVSAEGNSQLRLYGCGAMDTFGDILGDTEYITMTVFQPRLDSWSTETLKADELRRWRAEEVIPRAELALTDDAPFGPSQEACRWCPAAGVCIARVEAAVAEDFGMPFVDEPLEPDSPEVMSPEQIGQVLKRLPEIRAWCTAVEEAALEAAYSQGKHIPGWKVVMSGGQRVITDHPAAIHTLIDAGFKPEQVSNIKAKGIGELEKLLGKKRFPVVLEGLIGKTPGREALVPEDDKRQAISPATQAAVDFKEEPE